MKRSHFLCILVLTALCALTALPTHARAAEITASGECGDDLTWTLDGEGTLTVSGTGPMWNFVYQPFIGDSGSGYLICSIPWYVRDESLNDREWYNPLDIRSVVLEEGVESVGAYAFYMCNQLESVTLPDSLVSVGNSAFALCHRMTDLQLPAGVTAIGDNAFYFCTALAGGLRVPAGVTAIGRDTFRYCGSLTSVELPEGLTSVGDRAFSGCGGLTELTLPAGVTSIGAGAFSGCGGLTELTLPAGVASIGAGAFSGCGGLTELTLPAGVTSIGDSAFSGCGGLTSVTLPDGLTNIDSGAFSACTGLTEVTLPKGVTSLGDGVFRDCRGLKSIGVAPDNPAFASADGVLFSADGAQLLICPQGREGAFAIPDGVTAVAEGAFSGCVYLMSVTIPAGVTSIGEEAFRDCEGLAAVVLPDSVTALGSGAFGNCSGLAAVSIPAGLAELGGDYAFDRYCAALEAVYFAGSREQWSSLRDSLLHPDLRSVPVFYCCVGPTEPGGAPTLVFTDVSDGDWFQNDVAFTAMSGMMNGVGDGRFDPAGTVSVAQAITMAARIHRDDTVRRAAAGLREELAALDEELAVLAERESTLFEETGFSSEYFAAANEKAQAAEKRDELAEELAALEAEGYFTPSGENWYDVYVDYARENQIIGSAYDGADMDAAVTRAQFAEIFAHALPEEGLEPISHVPDGAIPDVGMSDSCAAEIYRLYRAGVLSGSDSLGSFLPLSQITRAETAAIVSRMTEPANRRVIVLAAPEGG